MQAIKEAVKLACQKLFDTEVEIELTRPDERFGDFATNAAMQLAGKIGKNPREIGAALAEKLRNNELLLDVQVAGFGFLNFTLTDTALFKLAEAKAEKKLAGQKIVAEYSDPNPFKVLHAGHLYTSVVGDAIANLLETSGAEVHRVNFGGDVGLHVGKTMWAIIWYATQGRMDEEAALFQINAVKEKPLHTRAAFMAERYTQGTDAYEDNEAARAEIIKLNKRVYQLHAEDDHESAFAQIYWTCRQWSYDYFDEFYMRIGSKFEKYYAESSVADLGLKTVRENTSTVFEKSDGAIVFRGEKYGLHTRVFVNSEGIPTYETKDVGLIMQKKQDYDFDRSVIITGNEQMQYMQVVLKAIEQFAPELAKATTHLTHGMVKLKGGQKMSSRKGNILRAVDVIDAAAIASEELTGNEDEQVVLAAVKYAFLKQRIGGDIIYDPAESVVVEGNSGPYLQYAYARAKSILAKAENGERKTEDGKLEPGERSLLRKLGEYSEVVEAATVELVPHHVCTYLYELAQTFNRFYEKNRVIGDPRQNMRLRLVSRYADVLAEGLEILGISAPEKM
jgi:arginyl-tRNA synthetase